jgi:CheY-like chemotaxis protein
VGKGTGLGLSTVLGIVKSHGGFVTAHSELGRGATFKVFLPAKPNAVVRAGATEPTALPSGQGELILVVDDEAPIRNVTQKTLERHGYRVETAANGNEAMALYARRLGQNQLVLTDISMPMMGGVALARALKRLDPLVKIIVSTGQGQDDKVAELNGLGVTYFLDKPYNTEKLLVTLREALAS